MSRSYLQADLLKRRRVNESCALGDVAKVAYNFRFEIEILAMTDSADDLCIIILILTKRAGL